MLYSLKSKDTDLKEYIHKESGRNTSQIVALSHKVSSVSGYYQEYGDGDWVLVFSGEDIEWDHFSESFPEDVFVSESIGIIGHCSDCGYSHKNCTCNSVNKIITADYDDSNECHGCGEDESDCACFRCDYCENIHDDCECSYCESCELNEYDCECSSCMGCGEMYMDEPHCDCVICYDCVEPEHRCDCKNYEVLDRNKLHNKIARNIWERVRVEEIVDMFISDNNWEYDYIENWSDEELFKYIEEQLDIVSMVDSGCINLTVIGQKRKEAGII